ncbi:MAG: hypothetical protein GWO20_09565 [Candidatus Korarchaeota archaeon]|nr:hypothetical protein [Candidatus Korarchaeota archaeon]NIU83704.1 hypothetical protein [Candidatus Thorarchaeota archaeon]NIW14889.1 hypothetical protein [Candidatus Thorarchaeota archaeon]NIW52021.1 hypothetical protein [Candidatus Korarchaeota archaeon]
MTGVLGRLSVFEEFIKQREEFFDNVLKKEGLKTYFINANLATLVFSVIYGVTMGVYPGGWQILYTAVKIPLLLLLSVYITAPSFYVLTALLGGECSFSQLLVLFLSSLTIMSTVLLALFPVNLFFILTTANTSFITYAFIVLLNVAIFGLAGLFALSYLSRGYTKLYTGIDYVPAFLIQSIIFILVGTQLSWVLRPYFHYYPGFIRPIEDNFYIAVLRLIYRLLMPA